MRVEIFKITPMRKALFLILFLLCIYITHAQRFFYVETGSVSEQSMKESLEKASQFVSPSPLGSDYILQAHVDPQNDDHSLTMNIILKDTLTSKTIFESNETYRFGPMKTNPKMVLHMAINDFIDRNLSLIILTTNANHYNEVLKNLREKKDHT
jgi:hypothetical protein